MRNRSPRTAPATGTQPESRLKRYLKAHYRECLGAIGYGFIGDAILLNTRDRVKEVFAGTGEILAGTFAEPAYGIREGFQEFGKAEFKKGILSIFRGVRNGIARTLGGVIDIAVSPLKFIRQALYGGFRGAIGVTGLVGLGGDIGRLANPPVSSVYHPEPAAAAA